MPIPALAHGAATGVAGEPPAKRVKLETRTAGAQLRAVALRSGAAEEDIAPLPEELEVGAAVFYWDGRRAVISEVFDALDEFWLADENTGDVIRNPGTLDVVAFKADELRLAAAVPKGRKRPAGVRPASSVLLLGSEEHMLKCLEHFGSPDATARRSPQQLLALPCSMCESHSLLPLVSEGVDDVLRDLAKKLRPDIVVGTRAYHMQHAVEAMGPNILRLDGYYCLSGVVMPFGLNDFMNSKGEERKWREDVCNQMDLNVTAIGQPLPGEVSVQETARRALSDQCGIAVSETIWAEKTQQELRKGLNVEIPLKFTDANEGECIVLLLPSKARALSAEGVLGFSGGEPPSRRGGNGTEAEGESKLGVKTLREWDAAQDEFTDLPPLPAGWMRIKSRHNNQIYYVNKETQETTFEIPKETLPPGWTHEVSKSSGRAYYFHAKNKLSQFDLPKV